MVPPRGGTAPGKGCPLHLPVVSLVEGSLALRGGRSAISLESRIRVGSRFVGMSSRGAGGRLIKSESYDAAAWASHLVLGLALALALRVGLLPSLWATHTKADHFVPVQTRELSHTCILSFSYTH